MPGKPSILTIVEVAAFLRIPVSSAYKLAQTGRIPSRKVGRHWRFHRGAIEKWLSKEGSAPSDGEIEE